jgi:hypothetical protein
MKSKNNKENHRNCQNQGLGARFVKSKDPTSRVAIYNGQIKRYGLFELLFCSSVTRPALGSEPVPLVHNCICQAIYLICLGQILI